MPTAPLADADRADKDQQHAKAQPLQKYLADHFRFTCVFIFPLFWPLRQPLFLS